MKRNSLIIGLGKKKHAISFTYLLLLILLCVLTGSLSFTQSPSISPSTAYTTNDINCTWIPSADTVQVNVSWLKDGVLFFSTITTQNSSSISYQNTTKNQNWSCNVTLKNATSTTWQAVSKKTTNSPPDEPNVFNTSSIDIGSVEIIYEDQSYNYDINSTDPDGDTLSYRVSPVASFCTVTDANTGATTCSPTSSDLGPGNTVGQQNITFWADDTDPFYPTSKGHTVLFNITPVNDNPYFSPALSDQNINEGQVFNYAVSGADEENNLPFNFTLNVSPSLALVINITGSSSALIMFETNRTAMYSEAGNYTVNVTVYDNQSANTENSFTFTINQINAKPVLQFISTQNGAQGSSLLFYTYADDVDTSDTLNFTIVPNESCPVSNPWSITTINNSNNATGMVNVSNLTNNHVACRKVNISVIDDSGAVDSQSVFLNISNTNDPPNIWVLSSYPSHIGGNNISNLTGYAQSPFIYRVNATDPDQNTYMSEVLTYSDNTTFFDINTTTGLISFTPNQSIVGNHTIRINVSDDEGLKDTQIMNLEIRNNSAPALMSIGDLACTEDSLCFYVINASDANNDNLTFTSNNTVIFNLTDNISQNPMFSAYVNYTPTQGQVRNYSVVITVIDAWGAYDTETINFTINNTNDAPVLQGFAFPTPIVETYTVSVYIYATDEDYNLINSYEYVNFSDINVSGKDLFNISTILNSSNNQTYARILFVPQIGDAGTYSYNITATDYYGAKASVIKNFTVLNKSNPPNIIRIRPYGKPYSNVTVFSFTNASNYNSSLTTINFSENRSVLYNVSVTDDYTAEENMSFTWYVNGSVNSTSRYINIFYGFLSSRTYNVTVVVTDDTYENASWTWNVSTQDINRQPLLLNSLNDMSVNATTIYTDYLKKTVSVHFLDPDDDLNSDNDWDVGETSNLNYNVTSCSKATIIITGNSVRVEPVEVGNCTVYFTAYDSGGLSNTSNSVLIQVNDVPNATQEVEVPSSSTGGGGSSRSSSVMVPITQKEQEPQAIEIIVPELVTVYKNKTVVIPVILKNTWNSTLFGISVNASTNASFVNIELTETYVDELLVGERKNLSLMVSNYRLGENYEVKITANVTNPKASDSALVMLNSIEQSEEGENVETKVTFAQDLLRENPECIELNELLSKAREELRSGSREIASRMVSGVIEGCKYLVSISKKEEQQPTSIINKFLKKENFKYLLVFLGLIAVTILTVLIIKGVKTRKAKEKEEKKKEEKKVKPYWP